MRRNTHGSLPAAALLALALCGTAVAETLVIDPDIGAAPDGPPRNSTMSEVEARHGPPKERTGPVGDPPITVWHYDGFKVYFEHDRVLHSTSRRGERSKSG